MSAATGPILALDSGSPRVSVAVGRDGEIVSTRAEAVERSSTALLRLIDEALAAAGLRPADLAGVAALAGPGSFTGLRIGLATAMGFAQGLGIAATAVPTLAVLAAEAGAQGAQAPDQVPGSSPDATATPIETPAAQVPGSSPAAARVVAAVDVLRGEWAIEVWEGGIGRAMEIVAAADLARFAPATISGWGVGRLAALPGWPADVRLREPGPLAPAALALLPSDLSAWDGSRLTAPIYGRPPAVTQPRQRAAAGASGAIAGTAGALAGERR